MIKVMNEGRYDVMANDYTRRFSLSYEKDQEIKDILTSVYNSLREKGYNY